MERKRPRTPYSNIFDNIDGHKDITDQERIQVKAIDIMVEALLPETNISEMFGGLTLADKSRLTDRRNPDFGKDLLMSVHTPNDFLVSVEINNRPKIDKHGFVVDNGLMHRWGERMAMIAQPLDGDLPDEVEAKRLVRELLEEHEEAFDPVCFRKYPALTSFKRWFHTKTDMRSVVMISV